MSISSGRKKKPNKNTSMPRILVGICSALGHRERRDAIRETWISSPSPAIACCFFVGGTQAIADEPDTLVLDAPDTYNELPEKVLSFFRTALETFEFDWLFKCDDDTYLDLSRLHEIISSEHDLVGNEFLTGRGSPSGGAGYLLSRAIVEKLVKTNTIPRTGAEDILIGEAAINLGGKPLATERLCWNNSRFPEPQNDVVTSHWCSPGRLRTIHAILREEPEVVEVEHPVWKDRISLFPSGHFSRISTPCSGKWTRDAEGILTLDWFDWGTECFRPGPPYLRMDPVEQHPSACTLSDDLVSGSSIPRDPHGIFQVRAGKPRVVAVWMTTTACGLPHLDTFLQHNGGIPVHVTAYPVLEGPHKSLAWRSADQPIRDWWLKEGFRLDFDYAVFLEWDVLFAASVDDIFPGEEDFLCRDVKKPGAPWQWFQEIGKFPEAIRPHATGIAPLAVTRISRRCLTAMFSHAMADRLYGSDIFCELRLPTLATVCGYEPVEAPGTLVDVAFHPVEAGSGAGVWHAVKHKAGTNDLA